MDARRRYLETLLHGKPDRVPLEPGAPRESTRRRWHEEGLPEGIDSTDEIVEHAYRLAGGKETLPRRGPGFPVDFRMRPWFEEKILEERERTYIVQDWKGNICEIGKEYSLEHLRNAIDFVTRRWIKCPVETRADWEDMMSRYDPLDPARLPDDPAAAGRRLADRTWPLTVSLPGPFWQLREWLGFENLCVMLYDDRAFVEEMVSFWDEFVYTLLGRVFEYVVPDIVHVSEDMAYKGHAMISPAMVEDLLLPVYTRWGKLIEDAGCPVYAMDSDGYIGELIPLWIEAGINVVDPVEVAAGNDIVEYRRRFGERLGYRGGVDKRAIAAGGEVLEKEISRIAPVVEAGGYIPGCDHGVPSDVSWENFVRYVELLARVTGWL